MVIACDPNIISWNFATMINYLSMTQGGHGYFCVGMTSLPADDAREACFLMHRTAAPELDGISVVPMGVNLRALS